MPQAELSRLMSTLSSEVEGVEQRVGAVMRRKEAAVAALAGDLKRLQRANDDRSKALERLRRTRTAISPHRQQHQGGGSRQHHRSVRQAISQAGN